MSLIGPFRGRILYEPPLILQTFNARRGWRGSACDPCTSGLSQVSSAGNVAHGHSIDGRVAGEAEDKADRGAVDGGGEASTRALGSKYSPLWDYFALD